MSQELQKYTITDMSFQKQVNVKRNTYSNSCYVDYLHELTFSFYIHVIKHPVLRRVAYYCLPLFIKDEWCSQHEHLAVVIYCHVLNSK